ncbi:MAG: hypothetical protein MJZ61_01875 [Bacteroidales bacterium]|nr:hypothetical protein [Bacteroidales bacterium]
MKKIIVFGKQIMLAAILFAGVGYYSSCSDDDLTDVAAVRPEGEKGTDPTADVSKLDKSPKITDIVANEKENTMTIKGVNLMGIIKIENGFKADVAGTAINGAKYNAGDTVVAVVPDDKILSKTDTEIVMQRTDGANCAYYGPYDVTKRRVDGGWAVVKPSISDFKASWDGKNMTITGENLDKAYHIYIGDVKAENELAAEEFTIADDAKSIVINKLWEGKITIVYDQNNPNRTIANDGYKFPVPAITKVTKNSDGTMTIEGTNLGYITSLSINSAKMDLPDMEMEAKTFNLPFTEGAIEAFYLYNGKDNEKKVSHKGLKSVKTELVDLTQDMFMKWTKADATGESSKADGCTYEIGKELTNGATFYGDGGVHWSNYADLSEYKSMEITFKGDVPRLLFNRKEDPGNNGTSIEIKGSALGKYASLGGNDDSKVLLINIEEMVKNEGGFCHLNVGKVDWGQSLTISQIKLEKVVKSYSNEKTLPLAAGDGTHGDVELGTVLTETTKNDFRAEDFKAGDKITVYYSIDDNSADATLKALTISSSGGDLDVPTWGANYKKVDKTKDQLSFVLSEADITSFAQFPLAGKYLSFRGTNIKITKVTIASETDGTDEVSPIKISMATAQPNAWDAQFDMKLPNNTLENGKDYVLEFKAKSNSANFGLQLDFGDNSGSCTAGTACKKEYSWESSFFSHSAHSLYGKCSDIKADDWTTYKLEFSTKATAAWNRGNTTACDGHEFDYTVARFGLGKLAGDFYIKDIVIYPKGEDADKAVYVSKGISDFNRNDNATNAGATIIEIE